MTPPLPHQNPPTIPAETVRPGTPDMAQICAMLAAMSASINGIREGMEANTNSMNEKMEANTKEIKNNTNGIKEEMKDEIKKMRGEMQQMGHWLQAGMMAIIALARDETRNMGRCLQAGKMATPRAGTSELEGSATAVRPAEAAGEDRAIRETCWARREEATVTVTQGKLIGVTETCKSETGRQVTELTETREVVERLHGVEETDGVKEDERTHTQVVRDNGGELAERVGTRCEQLVVLPREQGEGVCPLEAGLDQVNSVVPREVEEVGAADGCTQGLGGCEDPGSSCRGE